MALENVEKEIGQKKVEAPGEAVEGKVIKEAPEVAVGEEEWTEGEPKEDFEPWVKGLMKKFEKNPKGLEDLIDRYEDYLEVLRKSVKTGRERIVGHEVGGAPIIEKEGTGGIAVIDRIEQMKEKIAEHNEALRRLKAGKAPEEEEK